MWPACGLAWRRPRPASTGCGTGFEVWREQPLAGAPDWVLQDPAVAGVARLRRDGLLELGALAARRDVPRGRAGVARPPDRAGPDRDRPGRSALGCHREALAAFEHAVELYRRIGIRSGMAQSLLRMADVQSVTDETLAGQTRREAHAILDELGALAS